MPRRRSGPRDSRAYRLTNTRLRQVTQDHSLVAGLLKAGLIRADEVRNHPDRNIITRCLGTALEIEVDLFIEEIEPGDAILLCSDGLWEMALDQDIENLLRRLRPPQRICDELVRLANGNGGADNISVVAMTSH